MLRDFNQTDSFHQYYSNWIEVYKKGAVRDITLNKYMMSLNWLTRLAPDLKIQELNRISYQRIINDYAASHERQTTMDFHHQLKGSILDALDEGLIDRDPTRKVVIKGKSPSKKES